MKIISEKKKISAKFELPNIIIFVFVELLFTEGKFAFTWHDFFLGGLP